MKIAIITSGLLPLPATKGGAIETLIDTFTKENEVKKKLNIDIYTLSDAISKKQVKINNYKYTNYIYISSISNFLVKVINKLFKTSIPINKYYQKRVVNLVNKSDYQYIIIENYPELLLKLSSNKVIPYIHSDVLNPSTDNAQEILKRAYKVITVSDFIKSQVAKINNDYVSKIFTIYNSNDFDELSEREYETYRKDIRKKYNLEIDDFVYAFSGRISEEKGPLELVKAFNRANVSNKKLLIIGGIWYGCNSKNEYLTSLEKISNDNIIYTGYVNHKDIQKILCAVDVGVVPSICNEAAGLSAIEFMHEKNIVVASNMGGISEYLDKDNNYLVDYKNKEQFVNDLSKRLEEVSLKKNNLKDIGKKNYLYSKKYSVSSNYDNIVKVLRGE